MKNDYPLFDWLRFILASAVVLDHADIITTPYAANLAVQVFFALSGWLIGGILVRSEPSALPRFFFNRAMRIWLPYFAAVVALFGLSLFREPLTSRWLEFLFYDATFTHNWFAWRPDAETAIPQMPLRGTINHFWSISVEEQFYLAAPLLMLLPFGKALGFWVVVALCAVFGTAHFGAIALGVLAAIISEKVAGWHLSPSVILVLALLGLASAVAIILRAESYWLAAPLFSVSVVLLLARPGHRGGLGRLAGGISYPMYLNHWAGVFAANSLAKAVALHPILWGLMAYAGGVLAGAVAYALIDRHVMVRRQKWFSPRLGLGLAVAAYALVLVGLVGGIAMTR